MADNFNLRQFLTENKLTKNAKLLSENTDISQAFSQARITGEVTVAFYSEHGMSEPEFEVMNAQDALAMIASKAKGAEDVLIAQGDEIDQQGDFDPQTKGLECKLEVAILNHGTYEVYQGSNNLNKEAYQPKSKLEQIIQAAWAEKDLNKAKQMVIDLLEPSKVKSKDQIIQTLKGIQNKTRFDQYLANSLLKFEKLGLSEESEVGLNEWTPYGSIAFSGNDKPKEREPKEGEVELSTLNKGDVFKLSDGKGIEFRVWGDDPRGGVYVQYTNYDEPRPNYTMRGTTKVIKLDAKEKETVKESTLSPREKYLTRLVESALGIETTDEPKKPVPSGEGYGDSGVYDKLQKRELPPVEGPKYSEGISEDEMAQETVVPEYKSIEELMKNIQDGTNKVAEEHKISEMKKIAEALRKKKNTLEESEHAQYMNKADLKRLDNDIKDIEKAVAKAVATFDKKFNKKEKTSAAKAEKVEALQEGTFDLKKFLVENKLTVNSKMLSEAQLDEYGFDSDISRMMGGSNNSQPVKASFEGKWNPVPKANKDVLDKSTGKDTQLVGVFGQYNYAIAKGSDGKFYTYQYTQASTPGTPKGPFDTVEKAKEGIK